MKKLMDLIESKRAKVGIIGMGYVGLPLGMLFCKKGFTVMGFDIDDEKVRKLNSGNSYIKHISSVHIAGSRATGRFEATADFDRLGEADCVIICVPTPLTHMKEPDMSYIVNTGKSIARRLRKGQLVVLESTTYPGTTEEVLKPMFDDTGLKCGKDYFLAFSPEREDPGNPDFNTELIPKVVGGLGPEASALAQRLYGLTVQHIVPASSMRVAESAKLLENIYRCVNIALVNELKVLFDKMGIDIWEVIEAASSKPFGFQPFYPGPGLGGHCIPIDPFYLSWKAKEFDCPTRFIELAGEINTDMPYYVVHRTMEALNDRRKAVKGSRILVLGVAYKRNVDDMRESPSIRLIELFMEKGAAVQYNDPYIPHFPKLRAHKLRPSSVPLTEKLLKAQDCVVIATDHSCYDYEWIVKHSKLVIDTRNATKKVKRHTEKIVKA
jgi:UDP-N-acetyl-D-glucosamine dehydrogenase